MIFLFSLTCLWSARKGFIRGRFLGVGVFRQHGGCWLFGTYYHLQSMLSFCLPNFLLRWNIRIRSGMGSLNPTSLLNQGMWNSRQLNVWPRCHSWCGGSSRSCGLWLPSARLHHSSWAASFNKNRAFHFQVSTELTCYPSFADLSLGTTLELSCIFMHLL